MKYKTLGRSRIKVSEIGFGAWTLGLDWWGKKIEEDEGKRMLKKAYDLGINFFETASITPLIKTLLFGLEYSFANSRYSFIETFIGTESKNKNSERHICNKIKSI